MTQKIELLTLSLKATGAITAERFVTAAGVIATAGGAAVGVSASDAAVGELFPANVGGTAIVVASAAIAVGAALQVATGGKAVTKSTGTLVAIALQAASADGDRIEVLPIPSA